MQGFSKRSGMATFVFASLWITEPHVLVRLVVFWIALAGQLYIALLAFLASIESTVSHTRMTVELV